MDTRCFNTSFNDAGEAIVNSEDEFLDELSLWSKKGRWPILFLNDPLAWQFIQKFNPETVVRIRKKSPKSLKSHMVFSKRFMIVEWPHGEQDIGQELHHNNGHLQE